MSLLHDILVLLGLAHDDPPVPLQVKLFDPLGRAMPSAPFVMTVNGEDRKDTADESGLATAGNAPESGTVIIRWRRRPEDYPADLDPLGPDDYEYRAEIAVVLDADPAKATAQRLKNLGYFGGASIADDVKAFQEDHGLTMNGDPNDPDFQGELVREHDGLEIVRPARDKVPSATPEEE
jgi:hypothetical protein